MTTLNVSVNKKLTSMKLAEKMTRTRTEDGSVVSHQNSSAGRLAGILNKANELIEVDDLEKREQHLTQLCATYKFRDTFDAKLPITGEKEKILKTIESSQFVIIQGGTGCGKTTQVPQYILDKHMKEKTYCNIIVTQPRRIAAISVAKRVSSERNWELGKVCGYQIGLDRSKVTEDTRILYVTTGVLLQKLISSSAEQNLEKYTHIILDEVHERDLDIDFVLLILKIRSYKNLNSRIILMSATIDCDLFAKYYSPRIQAIGLPSVTPIINIKSNTYNVQLFYWEDLVNSNSFLNNTLSRSYGEKAANLNKPGSFLDKNDYSVFQRSYGYNFKPPNGNQRDLGIKEGETSSSMVKKMKLYMQNFGFSIDEPVMSEEAMMMAINLLKYFDEDEISKIKNSSDYEDESELDTINSDAESVRSKPAESLKGKAKQRIIGGLPEHRGTVLIFVPGMQQIQQLHEHIDKELVNKKITILPLHSDIVIEQQVRVFERALPTWRKVIISTSIAESSITVPDIKYVIDFVLTKELYCDPYTNYTHLKLEWASKSSANQRRGRAGRVSDGVCYRLVSKAFYNDLDEYAKVCVYNFCSLLKIELIQYLP